jgi:endogenous inhibitor of DNA gyrase (YacG/DUF329 family)
MNPKQPLEVKCPTCGGKSRYAPDNPWRPFCSERCRSIDLGAWATESYRVPAKANPDDEQAQDEAPPQ